MSDIEEPRIHKKQRLKLKKKIRFQREMVTKDEAQKLLQTSKEKDLQEPSMKEKQNISLEIKSAENIGTSNALKKISKKRKNRKKRAGNAACLIDTDALDQTNNSLKFEKNVSKKKEIHNLSEEIKATTAENTEPPRKKKKKKNSNSTQEEDLTKSENPKVEDLNPADSQTKKTESIRARKHRKYQELLEEKKLKSELRFQQNCLNYLSKWKHSRATWKFEKLKQIWILQNMFDAAKIPDEVWDTVVDYFNNARGKIKATIISEALKVIESSTNPVENGVYDVKYKRARFIVQHLDE